MSTPETQRFETLRQEIDDQNITGPMKEGSEIHVELDEEPGGGINGADLYTQEVLEFRPASQSHGVAAPKDIRESWIKGSQQFDFEIRVRPICPSCNTLMGVGDLPDYLMGQCFQCLVNTCPICVSECISCERMMCNQHSYGHGVEGGPFCPFCLQDVIAEKEWQRQLQAYDLELEKLQKEMDHREVMEQIWLDDERDRVQMLLDYYKHQEEITADMIQSWWGEMFEQKRFDREMEQQERESQREHDRKMEEQFIKEKEIDQKHKREMYSNQTERKKANQKHEREMFSNRTEREKVNNKHDREMRDKDIKEKEVDQKHEREMFSNRTDRKKVNKKHNREMYSNRTERKKINKKHRREDKKIEYDHQEKRENNRVEEKKADQKHSRETSKINKKHNRETQKINNKHIINKQQEDRKDRKQKTEKKKAEQMMDLRKKLREKGFKRKPPRGKGSKSGVGKKRRREKKPATSIEIE